jgi:hypothetical protein
MNGAGYTRKGQIRNIKFGEALNISHLNAKNKTQIGTEI